MEDKIKLSWSKRQPFSAVSSNKRRGLQFVTTQGQHCESSVTESIVKWTLRKKTVHRPLFWMYVTLLEKKEKGHFLLFIAWRMHLIIIEIK